MFSNPARFYFTAQRKKYGRENSLSVETHELSSSSKKLKTVFIVVTTMVLIKRLIKPPTNNRRPRFILGERTRLQTSSERLGCYSARPRNSLILIVRFKVMIIQYVQLLKKLISRAIAVVEK